MLNPSMQELMKRVGNRYLLVNLAAQRARDIADESEEKGEPLPDKAVKLALDEIAAGKIVYRPGPRVETAIPQNNAIAAAMVDVDDTLIWMRTRSTPTPRMTRTRMRTRTRCAA